MENLQEKMGAALDFINEEDFVSAQKLLIEIIENEPSNIEAIKNLGLCEINLDNPPEAIKYFQMAVELDNEDATSLYYLASCLSRIGEKEQAIENFNKVIELRPDFVEVYKNLAMIYVEFSQLDSAIELIQQALNNPAIEPDYTLNYILATSYMLKKDNSNAIVYLERALELNENHLPIMNSLSSCYMNAGMLDKAAQILEKAFEIDNQNTLTAFNLGVLYQTMENYSEALKFFQISYQLEPSTTMLSSLANCALKAGEFGIACVMYKNLVMVYPNNSEYRSAYVEALSPWS
ncbi:MAG: tetratricopeptide repeat protein, partial [Candidatus Gastranaerophilales bacterium]|nr:tetratricopeptide repeat protein [Candidatus Gastranaerophilales bacterium]